MEILKNKYLNILLMHSTWGHVLRYIPSLLTLHSIQHWPRYAELKNKWSKPILHTLLRFKNLVPTLPTIPLSDMTGGNKSDYLQLALQPQKDLNDFFTHAVVILKTCKHILMCKIGGVPL